MIEKIIIYAVSLISIDIFYLLHKQYTKIMLKRINMVEKGNGIDEDLLTKFEDIYNKGPSIVYGLSCIFMGFYLNFISRNLLTGTFLNKLATNFEYIFLILLAYASFSVFIKYFKNIINFIKGFKEGYEIKENIEQKEDIDKEGNVSEEKENE